MRTLLRVCVFTCLVSLAFPAKSEEPTKPQPAQPVQENRIDLHGRPPIGALGFRLGELLLLEGKRVEPIEQLKVGIHTLRVEKIKGVAIPQPIVIWVENLPFPKDTICSIYGYESIEMIGQVPAYDQLAKLKAKPQGPRPQAGWHVRSFFWAIKVVAPATLKIPERKDD